MTAHPDDENNAVLVALSRGRGVTTALLTLTRGDGGQNAIGPELFEALGVLRTEELAAVHRHDGAEQFFGRAFEFGFSFSLEETLSKWGHQETLGDVVRVVRSFRPDVILTLPLEAPDHQHHVAAARLAAEAFRAAADPSRFPEQVREGVRPWQARKIYQGGVGGGSEGPKDVLPVVLRTGEYDPLLGMTWSELGSLARTFHKCQAAYQLKVHPGEFAEARYFLVDAEPRPTAPESDILDGVDASLRGLSRFASGGAAPALASGLAAVEDEARRAGDACRAREPWKALPPLRAGIGRLRSLRELVRSGRLAESARGELLERLGRKEREFLDAAALAHGLVFEATTEDADLVPGQTVTVTSRVFNPGPEPLAIEEVAVRVPAGWSATRLSGEPGTIGPNQALAVKDAVTVGEGARFSQPYWKRRPDRDRYDVEVPADESLPWSPPDVVSTLRYASAGTSLSLERPASFRYAGRWVGGEKHKVVNVVPAISVRMSPEVAVFPLADRGARREFRVTVLNGAQRAAEATLRLEAPAGWTVEPKEAAVRVRLEGEEESALFAVTTPVGVRDGEFALRAVATSGGREFREGLHVIAYDHIQERHLLRPARSRARALDVRVAPGARVGYVMGVGDEVPEAIRQLGIEVTLLSPDDLAYGDLSQYTTIVTGVRAYQARRDLKASHGRLMRYVEEGGNLVVQYNRSEFNQLAEAAAPGPPPAKEEWTPSPFAPYPARVTTKRVTDETAPVEILAPSDPVLTTPNRITARDWEGWVQERGIQFLDARDPRYVELVSAADPFPNNAGPKKGMLVVAPVGKGTWTYVGLGLFRQLPAGVPGAYRLLANLLCRPPGR